MSAADYSKVRFIGYAIPTAPADMVAVGDPNGSGAVAGTYRASDDFGADIEARAQTLKRAVDTAKAALDDVGDPDVLNVFLAPEFFWHGTVGPYSHKPSDQDPADVILRRLAELFPADEYPHFYLVLGTVITAEVADIDAVFSSSASTVRNDVVRQLGESWRSSAGPMKDVIFDMLVNFIKVAHSYPLVEVRNRALVISATPVEGVLSELGVTAYTTEKYFDSNEDFLLWDVTGRPAVTEPMTAYPVLDISGGDFKTEAFDPYAIVGVPTASDALHIGVEICLDHADHRLRRSVALSPWPRRSDGVDLHLIPSCGMQLHPPAVAARAGGWAFNCDGQYPLGPGTAGTPQRGVVGGVNSVYADYTNPASPAYGAHTQLARVRTAAEQADQFASGAHDATFDDPPEVSIDVLPVDGSSTHGAFFAGGPGAVHIYGKSDPLALRA